MGNPMAPPVAIIFESAIETLMLARISWKPAIYGHFIKSLLTVGSTSIFRHAKRLSLSGLCGQSNQEIIELLQNDNYPSSMIPKALETSRNTRRTLEKSPCMMKDKVILKRREKEN